MELLAHFTQATQRVPAGKEACGCCDGYGTHDDRGRTTCKRCQGDGYVPSGSRDPFCPGREDLDRRPRRKLRRDAAAPQYGPRPEFRMAPEDWPEEKRRDDHARQSQAGRDWKANIRRGLSLGHLSHDQAHELGYHAGGHDSRDSYASRPTGWQKLPHELYHVTTNLAGVRESGGLKSQQEQGVHSGQGLGSSEDDTISLTTDPKIAHGILRGLHEYHSFLNHGNPQDLLDKAERGEGAQRPFGKDLLDYHHAGDGGPGAARLHSLLRGKKFEHHFATQEEMDKQAPGWSPHPHSEPYTGRTDGRPMHSWWERDHTPEEGLRARSSFFKDFATFREHAGGHYNPGFMGNDESHFARLDPQQFALLHVRPKPGAQGYPMPGEAEWRTTTGDALETHKAERLHDGRMHEASLQRDPYVVYHGAHHDDVPSIQQQGLRPASGGQPTVTTSRDGAALYGGMRDWTAPKVLEFHVPAGQVGDYLSEPYEGTTGEGTTHALRQPLPPSMLRQVHEASRTAAVTHLANPYTGGHEWFHGTQAHKEDLAGGFADPAEFAPGKYSTPEGQFDDSAHWNRLLGTHFTADHEVADEFARGEHEGSSNEGYGDFDDEEGHHGVVHARLNLKNPKHYASEHDMDHEAYEHEHAAGNHPVNHLGEDRGYENDEMRDEYWPTAMRIHRDYGTEKISESTYGHHMTPFHGHPMRTAWLNTHPDKFGIAERFKQRLQAQGHDGITYRNEYEKTNRGQHSNTSAIVFHPDQAEITQHHHVDEPCGTHRTAAVDKSLPYMSEPDDNQLEEHLYRRHGLDPELYPHGNGKHWHRWHAAEHQLRTEMTHQHEHHHGEPLEDQFSPAHEIPDEAPDVMGISGGRPTRSWENQVPSTGPFIPDSPHYSARHGAWMPSERIFGPTYGLDHRLFDEHSQLRPEVRAAVWERMDQAIRVNVQLTGSGWQDYVTLYLAGSQASEWTSPQLEGNSDFDVLADIDYGAWRGHQPRGEEPLTNEQIKQQFNRAMRKSFDDENWHPEFDPAGTWHVTGYCNGFPITMIKPYAAYDISHLKWVVKPPHLPDWGPGKFPQGPALFQQARALAAEVRAILRLPEPYRTQEASRIWDYLHEGRNHDFTEQGDGWLGTGNVLEKFLDQAPGHLVDKLKSLKYATAIAEPPAEPFFHGTTHYFRPGDLIHPGGGSSYSESSPEHVYMTTNSNLAASYAGMRDDPSPEHSRDNRYSVYHVEPTGDYEPDPQHSGDSDGYDAEPNFRSKHPLRVVRRMPMTHEKIRDARYPSPRFSSKAAARQLPISEMGPLYHGTTEERAQHILEHGFQDEDAREHGTVYLTPHPDLASRYAEGRIKADGGTGKPAVLKVDKVRGVSAHEVGYYKPEYARDAGADYMDKGPEVVVLNHSAIHGITRHASSGERFVQCGQGHEHWGGHGAAGLLVRHRDETGQQRYLLQKRSPYVDHGSTWSVPGGALHQGESPEEGAHREASEELGKLPADLKHHHTVTDDHGGGWAYHTVVMDSPHHFMPGGDGETQHETAGHGWFTPAEVKDLDLHPGFAKSWEKVRRSRSTKTVESSMRKCSVYECNEPHHGHGFCSMHAARYNRTGDAGTTGSKRIIGDDETRFLSKVARRGDDECWVFDGDTRNGYGRFRIGGREDGKLIDAHVYAYEHFVGQVPKGYVVDHVRKNGCVRRDCVNWISHLEPVTQRENVMRSSTAKLSDEQVSVLHARWQAGETQLDLAKEVGVTNSTLSRRFGMYSPDTVRRSRTDKQAALQTTFEEPGTFGNRSHITREDRGTVPIGMVSQMKGASGEMPGEHRNRHGQEWEDFKSKITPESLAEHPLFVTVDPHEEPKLSEGNHRRDAAVENGHTHIPVTVRYYGHAERQGTLEDRHRWNTRTAAAASDAEPNRAVHAAVEEHTRQQHPELDQEPADRTGTLHKMLGRASFFMKPGEISSAQAPEHARSINDLAHHAARVMTTSRHALQEARPAEPWDRDPKPSGMDPDLRQHGKHFTWHYALALDGAGHRDAGDTARHHYTSALVGVANGRHDRGLSRDFPGSGLSPHRPPDQGDLPPLIESQRKGLAAAHDDSYTQKMLDVASNPEPGLRLWRGERRPAGEDIKSAPSVGMHWSAKPEAVITGTEMSGAEPTRPVVWQSRLDHPESQAIPRSHPMWRGVHMSMDHEAEVRLHPGSSVHVEGAWVGQPGQEDLVHPLHPDRNPPGWEWHPVGHHVPVSHRGHGASDYSEFGMPREAKASKTKAQVRYRDASPKARKRCGTCVMFGLKAPDFETGGCTLVKGIIDENAVCDRWHTKGKTAAEDMVDIYHHTYPESAEAIKREKRFDTSSDEYGRAYFTSLPTGGSAGDYGTAHVHLRMPRHLVNQWPGPENEPEHYYDVDGDNIKPHHFVDDEIHKDAKVRNQKDGPSDGMMVAFVPPATVLDHLQRAMAPLNHDTESRQQMHVTVLYLGKQGDFTDAELDKLPELIAMWARATPSFGAQLQGGGTFHNEGNHPVLGLVDVPGGARHIHHDLAAFLKGHGYRFPEDHSWIPHITLAYSPSRVRFLPKLDRMPWTVSEIWYVRAGRWESFPLRGASTARSAIQ